ncbi:MAG TPA: SusD/RagB family nutrient-binding outer membrane lipoprotein [Chitinophagaceae bacterium]|nr:SusD/RagB family nutrient-binding outer membrane lipoprotein [Chitinophagaceae bacterium]
MKKIIIISTFFAASVSLNTGCTKKIDEAYANPNADVRVPVEKLLPGLVSCMAANAAGHGPLNDIRFAGKYIQNFLFCNSGGRYDQMGGTIGSSDNAGSLWRIHFYDIGQNCNRMIQWGTEEKKWDYVGVGKAIFAWSWLTLSDYHGEVVSVDEALNSSQLTFSYGSQEQVYNYVKKLCYEALENLNKTGDGVSQANLALGDAYFYNGDVNKWKKFVYGILARVYNHLSNKSALYKPDSVIYFCNQSINANADNATVKFANTGVSGTANFFGPFRGNLASVAVGTETAIRQSAYIANLMTGSNNAFPGVSDPRAWYILRSNNSGTFVGLDPNKGQTIIPAANRPENFWGVSQSSGVNNTAPANDNNCRYIFKNAAEFPVITAAEIQFIKAEAAYRKGDLATALAAYKQGIDLNFDMLTTTYGANIPPANVITPTIKDNFLNNTTIVPATANELTLTHIMLQKYIALYIHGALETWVDMRRFHYLDKDPITNEQVYRNFTPPSGTDLYPDNGGKLVYRVRPRYNSEYVWNLNELIRIGADKSDYHTKECWFSQP